MSLDRSKHLTDEEKASLEALLFKVMQNLDPSNLKQRIDATALMLLMVLGCRASELLGMIHSDWSSDDKKHYFKITGLKGSRDRELPTNKRLTPYFNQLKLDLKAYFDVKGDNEALFPWSYSNLQRVWYMYRPVQKKMHSLRHTRAIEVYKKSKDIHLVKFILGHKTLLSTQVYVDYVENQANLTKFM